MRRKPIYVHDEPLVKVLDNRVSGSSHSPDLNLNKVRSFEKRQELFNILHSEDACHHERLHLAGFLKFVGYTLEEICAIIDKEASWGDYDATMTYCQVQSVFKPGAKDNETTPSFLNGFTEEVIGETAFTKAVSPIRIDGYAPKICIIENSRITCYFKKCDLCSWKDLAGRGEK